MAFSPERLYSGAVLRNLSSYPKLVGGLGPASTERAARFYDSVLDAEVVAMSSAEAAEFSKLADTTYRDVNIALANEYAAYADRVGVDIREVIAFPKTNKGFDLMSEAPSAVSAKQIKELGIRLDS